MKYFEKYIEFRQELWNGFEQLVWNGAKFPELLEVIYPRGENPVGLSVDSEGDSWFYAIELLADPEFNLHIGKDLIVGTSIVTFVDDQGEKHNLEPDILDLYWLSEVLDKHE